MAPAPRKSTGRAAPSRKGAASAVSGVAGDENIVELDREVTITEEHQPLDAKNHVLNREEHDASDAPATDIPAPVDVPVTDVDGDDAPAPAGEAPPLVDPAAEPPARDLSVLARLADTSGRSAVTPYGADTAPSPLRVLPRLRDVHVWTREGDEPLTARVVIEGWRTRINGINRFAAKGDRVTAPADVITPAVRRGTLVLEPQE